MTPTLQFAIACARLNWFTFPIRAKDKRPATKHGVRDCTTDIWQLREWFRDPSLNLAIAAGPSNLAIIDVDPRNSGLEQIKKFPEMPLTPKVHTGRGDGGYHLYFRAPFDTPLKNGKVDKNKGIDLKVGFGYVIAPPSIHSSGGTYEWVVRPSQTPLADLPEWIVHLAKMDETPLPEPLPKLSIPTGPAPLGRASKYLAAMNASISGQGGHNALLSAACAMVQGFELTEEESLYLLVTEFNQRCKPLWSIRAIQRKVREAGRLPCRHGRGWLLNRPLHAH